MQNKDKLFENISSIANQISGLMKQKFEFTKDEVNDILNTNSRDTNRMEHVLDSLLECIDFNMGEEEFFKIIERLMKLDSVAADDYLKFYEKQKTQ